MMDEIPMIPPNSIARSQLIDAASVCVNDLVRRRIRAEIAIIWNTISIGIWGYDSKPRYAPSWIVKIHRPNTWSAGRNWNYRREIDSAKTDHFALSHHEYHLASLDGSRVHR